ncbi:MAG: CopG family transcriptional regulator [Deltaproteobacteria bacterium]|nr:CopG family transcriptional regulator [Deltaproteobacteria bacterium]
MVTLSVKVPESLRELLDEMVRRTGKTQSTLIREALEQLGSRRRGARRRQPSLLARTRHLCGVLQSGRTDLASNPEHLEGFGQWKR